MQLWFDWFPIYRCGSASHSRRSFHSTNTRRFRAVTKALCKSNNKSSESEKSTWKWRTTYRYLVILLQMDLVATLYIDSNIQIVITHRFACNQKWWRGMIYIIFITVTVCGISIKFKLWTHNIEIMSVCLHVLYQKLLKGLNWIKGWNLVTGWEPERRHMSTFYRENAWTMEQALNIVTTALWKVYIYFLSDYSNYDYWSTVVIRIIIQTQD
jgi:hypothetical protein